MGVQRLPPEDHGVTLLPRRYVDRRFHRVLWRCPGDTDVQIELSRRRLDDPLGDLEELVPKPPALRLLARPLALTAFSRPGLAVKQWLLIRASGPGFPNPEGHAGWAHRRGRSRIDPARLVRSGEPLRRSRPRGPSSQPRGPRALGPQRLLRSSPTTRRCAFAARLSEPGARGSWPQTRPPGEHLP